MNKIDNVFKSMSEFIQNHYMCNDLTIIRADEPLQAKFGFVCCATKNGVEEVLNPTFYVRDLKHFLVSDIGKKYKVTREQAATSELFSNIIKDISNPASDIHLLYFTKEELKDIRNYAIMNEALE